jgi:hypothetical protein
VTYQYSYKDLLARSEKITWRVEDLIGDGKTLDFSKPFLPEGLARTAALDFLSADEKRILNQIRGHTYLTIFGLVEEFILPFVLDYNRPHVNGDEFRVRAFLEFANEEAKHIHLFRRFREEFVRGFGVQCDVIGPPEAIAKHILAHSQLSVALLILHIEWMSQRHFQESIEHDATLDPQFKSLLLHHWMEEHQHALLDGYMVAELAQDLSPADIDAAIAGYVALGEFLDGGLKQQVEFEIAALARATGRTLNQQERERFIAVQHQANRWTYIGSGMSHPSFLAALGALSTEGRRKIEAAIPAFS